MDFGKAINSHIQWKSKLADYIQKPDKSLQASQVSDDRKCELGQWLYGEGRHYSHLPEYAPLISDHARFHRAAASIIQKADAGQQVSDEIALGAQSEFAIASSAVVGHLMKLKKAI